MRPFTRLFLLAALLVPGPFLHAQVPADPSGHWEGSVQVPGMDLKFAVDLARNAKGELSGTLSVPSQKLTGLPLLKIAAEGKSISFYARRDQTLTGDLSDDGKSMSGTFAAEGAAVPFSLTRTGEPKIEPPVRSARIGKELEGTWHGTLERAGARLVLTMSNQPDGTATGRVVNVDEGGLEIPVAITQNASSVTLDTTVIVAAFNGVLNQAGTELVGTWTQGSLALPLTFRRADQ